MTKYQNISCFHLIFLETKVINPSLATKKAKEKKCFKRNVKKEMHCSREADQKDLCQASKIAAMPSAPASEVKNTRMSAERSRYVPSLPPSQCKTLWKVFLQGEK